MGIELAGEVVLSGLSRMLVKKKSSKAVAKSEELASLHVYSSVLTIRDMNRYLRLEAVGPALLESDNTVQSPTGGHHGG